MNIFVGHYSFISLYFLKIAFMSLEPKIYLNTKENVKYKVVLAHSWICWGRGVNLHGEID